MAKLNDDGLEPGKPVEWAEMRRIQLNKHKNREKPKPVTRYDIDKMLRAELVAKLKEHGIDDLDGKAPELRERLKRAMLVGQGNKAD